MISPELSQAFARFGVGVSTLEQPPPNNQSYPNWDGHEAFVFYGRVALCACACALWLSAVLKGKLGATRRVTIQEILSGIVLPPGPVWVSANDKRDGWPEQQAELLVLSEAQWLTLLTSPESLG